MNYISNPSKDDFLLRICRNIPGSVYREYFKRNPDEFSILRLRKPLNTLTDKALLELVVENIDSPVIIRIITAYIQESFKENKKESAREEKEKWVMNKALNDSYVDKQRDLCAKLSQQKEKKSLNKPLRKEDSREEQSTGTCAKNISEGKKERSQQKELSMEDTADKRENMIQESDHSDEETSLKQKREKNLQEELSMEDTADKRENMIQETDHADEEKISVNNSSRQENERSQQEELSMEDTADKKEKMIQETDHADKLKTLRGTINKYDYLSVCEIADKEYNKASNRMFRMADIDRNGNLQVFHQHDDPGPISPENRKVLYYYDGTYESGFVAVWGWITVPNWNNPEGSYIESEFRSEISPIELVALDCSSVSGVLEQLKNGIRMEMTSEQALFATKTSETKYRGLLCRKEQFSRKETGIYRLNDNIVKLPQYQFDRSEFVTLSNQKRYLKSIFPGDPGKYIDVKNEKEIVKDVLLSRATWRMFSEAGKNRKEWTRVRDFLENLDTTSVVETISEKAECSPSKAKDMLNDFLAHVGEYLDGNSVEDQVLQAEIYSNEELMNHCKELIRSDWEKESHKEIEKRKNELTDIEEKIRKAKDEYTQVENQIKDLQSENLAIQDKISENKQLAEDVENKVEERIQDARNNAAEFIAEMAFYNPQSMSPQKDVENLPVIQNQNMDSGVDLGRSEFQPGVNLNAENLEKLENWKQALNLLRDNLLDAGVSNSYAEAFAAYLYASFLNRTPILLAGPGSAEIADAFSLSFFGKRAGVLVCEEPYSHKTADECLSSGDEVVRIVNPFHYSWVSRIPELVIHAGSYFFATCPYIEDAQVAPKSLYNYFLPVFTEQFIEDTPQPIAWGGRKSDSFIEYQCKDGKADHYTLTVSGLRMHSLIRNRIQRNLGRMHSILNELNDQNNQNQDYDVLFALAPYAEATMQMPSLLKAVCEQGKLQVTTDLKNQLTDLYGVLS